MHNRRNVISREMLVSSAPDTEVKAVSQATIPNVGNGVCGGLGVVHILEHLKKSKTQNPFERPDLIQRGRSIQESCNNDNECFIGILKNEDLALTTSYLRKAYAVEKELETMVKSTHEDGQARGVFLAMGIKRNPITGRDLPSPLRETSGHALTLTVAKHNEELECSVLDSNLFFAKGRGQASCSGMVKRLGDAAIAYRAYDIDIVSSKTPPKMSK